ncbi:acid protease [Mollisia scopiformis]|uniref:Acid protease n=1 Tax=Mollisia scopiformis TaxID=149040 RepID=A0A132B505_MOLSC|nr:acid protease [Mollisia scopiformis]KUJ06757.1 acid protease [Mollisia scopiformis]
MMSVRKLSFYFASLACVFSLSSCFSNFTDVAEVPQIYGNRAGFSVDAIRAPPSPRNGTEISAISGSDSHWWATISVGNPPQLITVILDSGTVDLSLMSTFINPAQRGLAPVYDPDRSNTAVLVDGYTWYQQYAGSAPNMGWVVQDEVRVGGIFLTNFTFEIDNVTVIPHITSPPYGTLGLDPDPNGQPTSPKRMPGWLQTVMNFVHQPVFCIDFRRNIFRGVIDFGYIDSKKYNGSIAYTPVTQPTLWSINIDGVGIGGGPYQHNPFEVFFDTGGDGLVFPRWAIDNYFAQVPNSTWDAALNTYSFDCTLFVQGKLPNITFGIGDSYRGVVPADHIHVGLLHDYVCVTSLRVGDRPSWGTSIIATQFVVFDYGGKRMGFAHKQL